MRKFETLLLLSPELGAEARNELLASFSAVIERESGVVTATDHWGMQDLAYPVHKQMRGYFVRLEYTGPGAIVRELERNIRNAEGIFKFISVRLEEEAPAQDKEVA